MRKLKRFIKKVLRAYSYAKFSWTNEEWDGDFFFELLKFKLIRMEKYFRLHGVAEDHEKTAWEIRGTLDTLQLILDHEKDAAEKHERLRVEYGIVNEFKDCTLMGKGYKRMVTISTNGSDVAKFRELAHTLATDAEYQRKDKLAGFLYMLRVGLPEWWD